MAVRRLLAHGALLLVIVLFLPGAGCDLFSTRDPEVSQDVDFEFEPPTSPQVIVKNLQNSFRVGAFNDYRRTMTDDFVFEPDPQDVAQIEQERPGSDVYADWGREAEAITAEEIFGTAASVSVALSILSESFEDEGRQLRYDYTLTLEMAAGVEVYRGQAWFTIRQEPNGDWIIFRWEDKATVGGVDSWGLLKGRRRSL